MAPVPQHARLSPGPAHEVSVSVAARHSGRRTVPVGRRAITAARSQQSDTAFPDPRRDILGLDPPGALTSPFGGADWERERGEGRWLAQVLDGGQLQAFLESYRRVGSPLTPMPVVAAAIRLPARRAVAVSHGEDAGTVVRSMGHDASEWLGVNGLVTAELDHQAAVLPTSRDGPTLTGRLRTV
jgi:hypothetical protein